MLFKKHSCIDALRKAAKDLRNEGLNLLLDTDKGRLVVPFRNGLKVIFNATCENERLRIVAFVEDFKEVIASLSPEKGVELLMSLMSIPTRMKLSVGIDKDGDLEMDMWSSLFEEPSDSMVKASLTLIVKIVKWLDEQIESIKKSGRVSPPEGII